MILSPAMLVINTYCDGHQRILTYLQKLSNEQLQWHLNPSTHSIAWHAWHLGRWADHIQACIPGMTEELGRRLPPGVQLWEAENLADRWGFSGLPLGYASTGMSMPDDLATSLSFPAKDVLLDYVGSAFALADKAARAIDDEQFQCAEQPQPLTEGIWGESSVGDAILSHLDHDSRHLGMMECLLGLQGQPGKASQ